MSRHQISGEREMRARAPQRSSRGVFADALAMDLRLQAAHAARCRGHHGQEAEEEEEGGLGTALAQQCLQAADEGDMELTLESLRALAQNDSEFSLRPRDSQPGGGGGGAGQEEAALEEMEEEETGELDLTSHDARGADGRAGRSARAERNGDLSLNELEDLEAADKGLYRQTQNAARSNVNFTCQDLRGTHDRDLTFELQDAAAERDMDLTLQTLQAADRGNADLTLKSLRALMRRGIHAGVQPADTNESSEMDLVLMESQEAVDENSALQDLELEWRRDDFTQQDWQAPEPDDLDPALQEPQEFGEAEAEEAWQWREHGFPPAPGPAPAPFPRQPPPLARTHRPPPPPPPPPPQPTVPFAMMPHGTVGALVDEWSRRDAMDDLRYAERDEAASGKKSPVARYRSPPPPRQRRRPPQGPQDHAAPAHAHAHAPASAPPTVGGWPVVLTVPTRPAAHRSPPPPPAPARSASPAPRRHRPLHDYAQPHPDPQPEPQFLRCRRPPAPPQELADPEWAYAPAAEEGWEQPEAEWEAFAPQATAPPPPPPPVGRRPPRRPVPPAAASFTRKEPPRSASPPAARTPRAMSPQHRFRGQQSPPPLPQSARARVDAHEAYRLLRYNCPTLQGDDLFTSFSQAQ